MTASGESLYHSLLRNQHQIARLSRSSYYNIDEEADMADLGFARKVEFLGKDTKPEISRILSQNSQFQSSSWNILKQIHKWLDAVDQSTVRVISLAI